MESDNTRARMLDTLAQSAEYVRQARYAGVYADAMAWLAAYNRGQVYPFPYGSRGGAAAAGGAATGGAATGGDPRWSMYTTPIPAASAPVAVPVAAPPRRAATYPQTSQELIVSPAAKALDYFQQSLELLGIGESEAITPDRLRSAYKRASLRAHPDKGGSPEAFDEVNRAFKYVEKILQRINPKFSASEEARMTAPVTAESAAAYRATSAPQIADTPPVALSAKKLDMGMFNKLFEENRLPDPTRDNGYGDWLKSQGGGDEVAADPRLKGKFSQTNFEAVFRERALQQTPSTAITKRLEPDALISAQGVELGGEVKNFTAAFGADTQFTDLKEAYTSGATMFQEVAGVQVRERSARTVGEAQRIREQEMARVDPDEKSRIAAAAAALEERERQRRMRLAQQDVAAESWHDQLRRRLLVNR